MKLLFFVTSFILIDSHNQKLVCYLETWAATRPSPMNFKMNDLLNNTCDYLILLFVTLNPETDKIQLHNGYTSVEPDQLMQAGLSKENNPGMRIILSVGGWVDGVVKYSNMMSEKSRRASFIGSVVEALGKYDLDGLELHWLSPGNSDRGGSSADKDNFVKLVKELVIEFKPRNWVVTARVPADHPALDSGFNVTKLNSLLHQIHVHTFDLRGDWSHAAENPSPLFRRLGTDALKNLNVEHAMALWVSNGASRRRLIPIFPTFGRSFTLESPDNKLGAAISGAGNMGKFTTAQGILAYYEICDLINRNVLTYQFDNDTKTPYAAGGNQWVGFDDEFSLKKKAEFVRERGYGGVALFAISMDDFRGVCGEKYRLLKKTRTILQ